MSLLFALFTAHADVPPLPEDCAQLEDGATCTTAEDEAGTCQDGECVANDTESEKRCATAAAGGAAGGILLASLGILAVRRRD